MIQAQGALDDPAAGQQHLEGVRVALADDLQLDFQAGGPGGELAGVSRISPGQHQAGGVDGDVPLAAAVLLGVIPARLARGTVSAACTGWESITAVVGRVAASGGPGLVASPVVQQLQVPSSCQRAK